MSCELFEIGILRPDGLMLLRSPWSAKQVDAALPWLRRENARGAHIFVRPHGAHALSLVDDLNAKAIARMTDAGFEPAAVVETSPGNFQVWLNHGRILFDRTFSTQAAKELARRFEGDPSSADWRHFGRLAGFTNQKPNRRLRNGLPPFVRLYEKRGVHLQRSTRISRGGEIAGGDVQRPAHSMGDIMFLIERRLHTTPQ